MRSLRRRLACLLGQHVGDEHGLELDRLPAAHHTMLCYRGTCMHCGKHGYVFVPREWLGDDPPQRLDRVAGR